MCPATSLLQYQILIDPDVFHFLESYRLLFVSCIDIDFWSSLAHMTGDQDDYGQWSKRRFVPGDKISAGSRSLWRLSLVL